MLDRLGNTEFDEGHIEKLEGWIDTLDSVSGRQNKVVISDILSLTMFYGFYSFSLATSCSP